MGFKSGNAVLVPGPCGHCKVMIRSMKVLKEAMYTYVILIVGVILNPKILPPTTCIGWTFPKLFLN